VTRRQMENRTSRVPVDHMEQPQFITRTEFEEFTKAFAQREQILLRRITELEAQASKKDTSQQLPPQRGGRTSSCMVCHSSSRSVHRHRELGILLDDKCRKQVETYKQGGLITERRSSWCEGLKTIQHNKLASDMLRYIEGDHNPQAGESAALSRKRHLDKSTSGEPGPSAQAWSGWFEESDVTLPNAPKKCRMGDEGNTAPDEQDCCTICREDVEHEFTQLPCAHKFHSSCIHQWLLTKSNCPTCRMPITQATDGGLVQSSCATEAQISGTCTAEDSCLTAVVSPICKQEPSDCATTPVATSIVAPGHKCSDVRLHVAAVVKEEPQGPTWAVTSLDSIGNIGENSSGVDLHSFTDYFYDLV